MEWMAAASSGPALGFLRRLLCANTAAADTTASSPTRPEEGGRSPCIVARLMGLDAMPAAGAQLPRRARSSLRDKPAYLRPENDAFLLLSFSPEERGTGRESADDVGAERRRKLRFGGRGDEAGSSSPSSSGSGRRECNTQQSSSPVSVLDERDESSTATSSSLEDVEPCSATSEEARFTLEQHSSSSTTRLLPQALSMPPDVQTETEGTGAWLPSPRRRLRVWPQPGNPSARWLKTTSRAWNGLLGTAPTSSPRWVRESLISSYARRRLNSCSLSSHASRSACACTRNTFRQGERLEVPATSMSEKHEVRQVEG